MHYFKRNIGDYHKKAGRLTMLQHGAYTLLLDACYDREQFPTMEMAIDWTWSSSDDEISAVKFVLNKFFVEDNGTFIQYRIKDEIDRYQKNASTNQRIAIERETKRREKSTKREQSVNDSPPNQEPLTNNHKIITKVTDDRFAEFWDLYDKKVDPKKCKAKWARLKESEITKIFEVVESYVKSTPEKKYRRNPSTWLNNEGWNSPIENSDIDDCGIDWVHIMNYYNHFMPHKKVLVMTDNRKENIKNILSSTGKEQIAIEGHIDNIANNPSGFWPSWKSGNTDQSGKFWEPKDFDFYMQEEIFIKSLEG